MKAIFAKPALGLVLAGVGGFAAVGSLAGEVIAVAGDSASPVAGLSEALKDAGALGVLVLLVGIFVWRDARRDESETARDKDIAQALREFSKALAEEGKENRKMIEASLSESRHAWVDIANRIMDRGGRR